MANATRLALDAVEEAFGATTRAVADALVGLGPSSLLELARYLAASSAFGGSAAGAYTRARGALLTLISHDTLELSLPVEEERGAVGARRDATAVAFTLRYEFKPLAALRIVRYPHYLGLVRGAFGAPGVAVAQALLMHGCWTRAGALAEAAVLLVNAESAASGAGGGGGGGAAEASVMQRPRRPDGRGRAADGGADAGASSSSSSAEAAAESAAGARAAVTGADRALAWKRVEASWDLLVAAALIVPHEGLSAFPSFTLASSAAAPKKRARAEDRAGAGAGAAVKGRGGARGGEGSGIGSGKSASFSFLTASGFSGGVKRAAAVVEEDSEEEEEEEEEEEDDDDDDEEDEEGAGDGVLKRRSGAAADASTALFRFGWEAATRRLRNQSLARYVANMLSSAEDPAGAAGPVVEAMLLLHEAYSSAQFAAAAAAVAEAQAGGGGGGGDGGGAGDCSLAAAAAVSSVHSSHARTSGASLTYAPAMLEFTPAFPAHAILAKLAATFAPPAAAGSGGGGGEGKWTMGSVLGLLRALRAHPSCVVVEEPSGWRFHMRSAILSLQLRTIEVWVKDRFGPLAPRILRRLLDRGMLEEKMVADLVLAEAKGVRVLLWKMVGEGLLTMQEVPRRPDRNPQYTSYLFCASWDRVLCVMAEAVCRGLLNLRMRRRLEKARYLAARRESESIFTAAEEREGGAAAAGGGGGGAEEGEEEEEGEGEEAGAGAGGGGGQRKGALRAGVGGANSARNVAQAKEMLEKLDYGVAALMMSILRADETLNILADY